MTKNEILTAAGQRLGDASTTFLQDVLSPIFDQVLAELAANDCLNNSLRRTATYSFVADQRDYSTMTICGLAMDYPLEITKLLVPTWGAGGFLRREEEYNFDRWRLTNTDSDGNPVTGQPRIWRLYPNDRTLQVDPVPSADYEDAFEVLYLAPPTALGLSDPIAEIHAEHMPVIIAGMIRYGFVFQDETLGFDAQTAPQFFELGMLRMKARLQRESGRPKRMKRHPVL